MFGHRQSQAAAVDICSLLAGSNPYRLHRVVADCRKVRQKVSAELARPLTLRPFKGLLSCAVSLSFVTSENGGEACCILACASPHADILPQSNWRSARTLQRKV